MKKYLSGRVNRRSYLLGTFLYLLIFCSFPYLLDEGFVWSEWQTFLYLLLAFPIGFFLDLWRFNDIGVSRVTSICLIALTHLGYFFPNEVEDLFQTPIDKVGWLWLIYVIFSLIYALYLLVAKGENKANQFGPKSLSKIHFPFQK